MEGNGVRLAKGMQVRVAIETNHRGEPRTLWEVVDGRSRDTGMPLCFDIWRERTEAEHREWLASDASKGMDDAGETKLDSPSRYRHPAHTEIFRVVRSRVEARRAWSVVPGCAEIEDASGVRWFVKRHHLRVVAEQ